MPESAKKVFKGILFDVYHWQQRLYDGSYSTFEMLKRKNSVIVIPTTTDKKILFLEQKQPNKHPFYSFPGGRVNDGESPKNASLRELREETGFVPEKIELWKTFQPASKMEYFVYAFIAKNCTRKVKPRTDSGESICIHKLTLDKLLALVYNRQYDPQSLMYEFLSAYYDKKYLSGINKLLFD